MADADTVASLLDLDDYDPPEPEPAPPAGPLPGRARRAVSAALDWIDAIEPATAATHAGRRDALYPESGEPTARTRYHTWVALPAKRFANWVSWLVEEPGRLAKLAVPLTLAAIIVAARTGLI